jgi:hypothetical protein
MSSRNSSGKKHKAANLGLEVSLFGASAATSTVSRSNGIASAAFGALLAGLLVILVGALVRAPLAKVPENTLKFVVGIMLTTFGTFWTGEGFGVNWPLEDVFLLILAAIYLASAFLLIVWLKRVKAGVREQPVVPIKERGVLEARARMEDQDTTTIVDALLVTPRHFSRSRLHLNSSEHLRSRRIRLCSPHGCSSPTCLRRPFPSSHLRFFP